MGCSGIPQQLQNVAPVAASTLRRRIPAVQQRTRTLGASHCSFPVSARRLISTLPTAQGQSGWVHRPHASFFHKEGVCAHHRNHNAEKHQLGLFSALVDQSTGHEKLIPEDFLNRNASFPNPTSKNYMEEEFRIWRTTIDCVAPGRSWKFFKAQTAHETPRICLQGQLYHLLPPGDGGCQLSGLRCQQRGVLGRGMVVLDL